MLSQLKKIGSGILNLANHDFCPSANRYVYWVKQPIGWVVGAIFFSILVGLFVGPQGYVLCFAFMALLILGLLWPWISMKGIRCEMLTGDQQIWENEEFEVVFKVQNYWPIPVFGMMVKGDFLQELGPDEEPIVFSLKRIPAWADTEFRIPVVARRRGVLPDGEINIASGFPFGLSEISRLVAVPKTATVWPACQSLSGQPKTLGGVQNVLGTLRDQSGIDGDTIGVRNFQLGDMLKNIHWAQSARSQKLMVRERQTLSSTTTAVILDLSPDNHAGEGVHGSYEWAIRLAASVCWQLHQNRSNIKVFFLGLDADNDRQSDNHLGVERLMSSFAELPTFAQVTRAAGSFEEEMETPVSILGPCFFIGTNRSIPIQNSTGNLKTIMIDLEGFGQTEKQKREDSGTPAKDDTSLWVTAPGIAATQLESGWNRSYSHVSG